MNRDGRPDLAITNSDGRTISVFANRGAGRLRRLDYKSGRFPSALAVGDVNRDGEPDLAVINDVEDNTGGDSTISVLANATGRCGVPEVRRETLAAATREIIRGHWRLGRITRIYSAVPAGRVVSVKPSVGALRPVRSRLNLVLSRGRR